MSLKKIKQLAQALLLACSLHLGSCFALVLHQAVLASNCSVQLGRRWDGLQQAQPQGKWSKDSSSFQGSVVPFLDPW